MLFLMLFASGHGWAQKPDSHELILRDLTRIKTTVSSFDKGGITLVDNRKIDWDEVLQARVDANQQKDFDQLVKEIGIPIFRLKTRIKQGDWWGAGIIADPMFELNLTEGNVFPNQDSEYLACLATMRSRMVSGQRSNAVLPFIKSQELQSQVSPKTVELTDTSQPVISKSPIGLANELLPVWFDDSQLESCRAKIAELYKYQQVTSGTDPSPALTIYFASMEVELGRYERAAELMQTLERRDFNKPKNEEINSWAKIIQARVLHRQGDFVRSRAVLESNEKNIIEHARPVALYYLGLAQMKIHTVAIEEVLQLKDDLSKNIEPKTLSQVVDQDLSKSALIFLRIPAFYGDSNRHLSAAALFQTAQIANIRGHSTEYKKIQQELFRRYPRTYHGSKSRSR